MKTNAGCASSHTQLTRFLENRVLQLRPGDPQIEIAAEAGFVQTNMLAMIRNGSAQPLLDQVP
ncbi:hypothetical protein [Rhizobium sp. C4]|uniref:hypothetical protein n=1 Tax=Rhizobium sp. C4 TaxID=1349800 RepID=UPI001E553FCA|nr:hypothetical protein [Rhizobium sp. C4]MCD2172780.1 hypothetical protein [Rhizobium sp. C4]